MAYQPTAARWIVGCRYPIAYGRDGLAISYDQGASRMDICLHM